MTLIKQIIVECSECNWSGSTDDSSPEWEKFIEMEDGDCPKCKEIFLEKLVGDNIPKYGDFESIYPKKMKIKNVGAK